MAELKERAQFELYGYCLMSNHFHLLIRPRESTISRLIQSLLISHTQRYHRHYRSGGHVWQGRFKSPVIQDDGHRLTVLRYVEANPLRAKIVKDASKYAWSSYAQHGLVLCHTLKVGFAAFGRALEICLRQSTYVFGDVSRQS